MKRIAPLEISRNGRRWPITPCIILFLSA